jgi:hypothetical protein
MSMKADGNPKALVNRLKVGQTPAQANAEFAVEGIASNSVAVTEWSAFPYGEGQIDLSTVHYELAQAAERVQGGSLAGPEAILTAQMVTLNALFTTLVHRAMQVGRTDQYEQALRFALKAQSQCRATCEALAMLKHPSPVFAKQANISAGPQQVNNIGKVETARTALPESSQIKLLEGRGGERLDGRAEGAAVGGDSPLETVDAIDGAANGRGQEPRVAECVSRRAPAEVPRLRSRAERVTARTGGGTRGVRVGR